MHDNVRTIIADHLDRPLEDVRSDTVLTELGASSYDLVTLVVRFEEEYNVYIGEDEIRVLRTVQDVEDLISRTR